MSAALELAPFGVTASMVCPPVTDTGWVTDAVRGAVSTNPALIHIASPAEVAAVIAYLAFEEAAPRHCERYNPSVDEAQQIFCSKPGRYRRT